RVEVFVPRKSNLRIDTDGEIRLDSVTGEIELKGDEESINIRDAGGNMKVATNSGEVRVIGFRGGFDAKMAEGDVYLEGDFDKLSANVANGTVVLTLPQDADAKITSTKEVETEGIELIRDNDYTWRLGKGSRRYDFDFGDGNLIVRSADVVNTY
ncbi:MAG TPA: DUF4097 family beta strand repeat-containing protein, partial [Pyrinomonadaceae bacterium]|nr:DUF4097 family beta strand repeat-containing protein [Pyrinomonadaceae bacterium]